MSEFYNQGEQNQFQNALENYVRCYNNYFGIFNSINDLKNEIERPDLNFVCKKQLTALRSEAANVGFKEMIGISPMQYGSFIPLPGKEDITYKPLI